MSLYRKKSADILVALFTRAWIEIAIFALLTAGISVALFTRAWIEIDILEKALQNYLSPSLRGRGLKLQVMFRL